MTVHRPSRGLRWVGDDFPSFRLALRPSADRPGGGRLASDDWRGRRTLVVVWPCHLSAVEQADLCVLCRGRRGVGDGIEVAGIAAADPWSDRLPERCAPFPLALDPARRLARALGLPARESMRAVYLVGPDGRIEAAAIAPRLDRRIVEFVAGDSPPPPAARRP